MNRLSPRSRRSLLLGLLPPAAALAVAGCGGSRSLVRIVGTDASPVTSEPRIDAQPTAVRVAPPVLGLPDQPVQQGGVFTVTVSGDAIFSAEAEFRGRRYQTIEENGGRLAVIPAGQPIGSTAQVPPGVYPMAMHFEITGRSLPRTLEGAVTIEPTEYPVEVLTFEPEVAALLEPALAEQETAMLRAVYGAVSPVRRWDGGFLRPVAGEVTDGYGTRRSYQGGPVSGSHAGVDIGARAGTPVLAAANGRVTFAGTLPVRGNMVILDHGAGVFTGYAHLAAFSVVLGQDVGVGEEVATIGSSGLSTGPHLHWEVVVGGMHVDGLRWLLA